MKNEFKTAVSCMALMCAVSVLQSCTAEQAGGPCGGNTVIEASASAPTVVDDRSRAAVDPTEYTSGQIGINWLPNDRLGVYGDKGTANTTFINLNHTESPVTAFSGNLADGEKPLYAYYPYSTMAGADPKAVKGCLPSTQYYSTSTREVKCDWKVGTPVPGSSTRFKFEHIFVFLKFEVNAAGSPLVGEQLHSISLKINGKQLCGDFSCDLTDGSCIFTPSADTDCIVMEWLDTPSLGSATVHGYVNCAAVSGLDGLVASVNVTTDKHIATFDVPLKVDRLDANRYYTVPLRLSDYKDIWTLTDNPDMPAEENAAWLPGLQSRLACANTVFALPGKPFMHKIRVPENPSASDHAVVPTKKGVLRVYNLPEGLEWNASRALVEGIAPAAGKYVYSVEFEIGGTVYKEGISLTVSDNLVSPTPMMGWQSWNVLEENISHDAICAQADAMVDKGFLNAGYNYLGIDDCWQKSNDASTGRNADGSPKHDESKFPDGMDAVARYIHSKGLKAGIYSDAGTITCEGKIGSYGYEATDAATYVGWGFNMLKEDWFWKNHGDNGGSLDSYDSATARELYGRMGSALDGRMMLYMCEWGLHEPWRWAAEVGSQCWRMSYDARDTWMGAKNNDKRKPNSNSENGDGCGIGVKNTIDLMRHLWPYVGINRYNDADMLCVGVRGNGQSSNDLVYTSNQDISDTRYQTNFAMWCMYSSPLLLTFDLTRSDINTHDLALLKNEELIAINQDPLGQGAEWIKTVNGLDYYMKDLADGDVAVAVVNLNDSNGSYSIDISDYDALDGNASYSARNLLEKAPAGSLSASSSLSGTLVKHGTFIVRLTKI